MLSGTVRAVTVGAQTPHRGAGGLQAAAAHPTNRR